MIVSCSNDLYANLSLAESCVLMESTINSIYNEAVMNVLLTEHSYLMENSCEITYVNEDGSDTKEGKSIKSVFSDAFKKIENNIETLWNKCNSWIATFTSKVKNIFHKLGIEKNKAEALFKKYSKKIKSTYKSKKKVADKFFKDVKSGKYFKKAQKAIINKKDLFIEYLEEHTNFDMKTFKDAIDMIFDPNTYIDKVKCIKEKALEELNSIKKEVLSTVDKDVKIIKTKISNIATLFSTAIKFVYTNAKHYVDIVKNAIKACREK